MASDEQIYVLAHMVEIDLQMNLGQLLRFLKIYNPTSNLATPTTSPCNDSVTSSRICQQQLALLSLGISTCTTKNRSLKSARKPSATAQEVLRIFRDAGLAHLLPACTATYRSLSGSLYCNALPLPNCRRNETRLAAKSIFQVL